ncbi:hypothetical protein Mapa_013740 [Marchantia paleacea]|nr:hypothetical protein Mapa_013740 [Marchantia paleacea]
MMGTKRMSQQGLGLLCILTLLFTTALVSAAADDKLHVVYLSPNRPKKDDAAYSHRGYLKAALGSADDVDDCLVYCYTKVFDGFAAKLTTEQATKLSKMEGVLSVVPNTRLEPTTTSTWKFLDVESSDSDAANTGALWERAHYGRDVIIGVIDTGIWPESESFHDRGLGPIPARWKGECVEGQEWTTENCNRKLIGAKYFFAGNPFVTNSSFEQGDEFRSARDMEGHGTHVAATAAGSFAPASWNGFANGTAKGGAPQARIAMYKVCWNMAGCMDADISAAIDEAIADGVDIISISISGYNDQPFWKDAMTIAAYQAMKAGILVAFAGSNSGPAARTVNHVEPWSFTVAATTHDRFIGSDVFIRLAASPQPRLRLRGATLNSNATTTAPLVLGSQVASPGSDTASAMSCFESTLDPEQVIGKIVFCLKDSPLESITDKGVEVLNAGGVGMIVGNGLALGDHTLETVEHVLPAVHITAIDSQRVQDYLTRCDLEACNFRNTRATIFTGRTWLGVRPAPVIADFSSTGPSGVTQDILKPDIAAPGVNVLAAWTDGTYNSISGTSMATPHISGVIALIKSIHPRWSPAAIKSAIMTTAITVDNSNRFIRNIQKKPAGPFSTGSGLVNPNAAVDPGLVYEAGPRDYTLFLCALGYTDQMVEVITAEPNSCSSQRYFPSPSNLNYPSVSVGDLKKITTLTRRVTNVGAAKSVYTVSIQAPRGVRVSISPSRLSFSHVYETKSFNIRLQRTLKTDADSESYVFGSYTWSDGKHKVRSPIVVGHQPQ